MRDYEHLSQEQRYRLYTLEKTGQVIIMIRSMPSSKDNPFDVNKVEENIKEALASYHGFYEIVFWRIWLHSLF